MTHDKPIPFASVISRVRATDGWLADREALLLYTAAFRSNPIGDIVEIGSWKGKSTVSLASAIRGRKQMVYAVDPHKGIIHDQSKSIDRSTLSILKKNLKNAHVSRNVTPIVKTSVAASQTFRGKVSLLFIDGLHDYKNARRDSLSWEPFLMDGGLIAFHDAYCGTKGVFGAMSELFESNHFTDIGIAGSIIYARKREHPTVLNRMFFRLRFAVIRLFQWIFRNGKILPLWSRFFLCHRIDKLFLYTSIDMEMHRQSHSYIW